MVLVAPCHHAAVCFQCCKGVIVGVDALHIYQLLLDFAAASTPVVVSPCDHAASSLHCCKGEVGRADMLHIYELLLDFCAIQIARCDYAAICPQLSGPV